MQVRNWLFTEDFAAAIDVVLDRRRGRAGLQRRRARGDAEHRGRSRRSSSSDGRDESLITYVDDRLGHDRRYSLVSERTEALGWKAAGRLRRGHRADRQLVPRQRGLVGPDPLRRVPRVLRAAVRARARRPEPMASRSRPDRRPRRVEPHGLRRRARLPARDASARTAGAELGIDADRSCRRTTRARPSRARCAASTSRPTPARASSCAAVARLDLRRRRRPAPRLADLRAVGGPRPRRRDAPPALGPGRLRSRLPGPQRGRRRRLQADLALRPRDRVADRLERPRRRDRVADPRAAAERPRRERADPRRHR